MKQILLEEFGGPETLRVGDHPEPVAPRDGYVVELRAISINYADIVERRGLYAKNQKLPFPIGKEGAGVVVARGPRAREFAVGDDVCVVRMQGGGCYAERVAVEADEVLPPPRDFSYDEMAAFPICHATAWLALQETARVRPGESVLIQAAAGGVGTAAIQQAIAFGCEPVIGTAGSAAKAALVEQLGATRCVDYDRSDFRKDVRELTGGRGVDYVLESVGGDVFDHSLESLADFGRLVIIGFTSIDKDYATRLRRLHPLTMFQRSISVAGLNVQNLRFPRLREHWERLLAFTESNGIRPVVGSRFGLDEAPAAHAALECRNTVGKVVMRP